MFLKYPTDKFEKGKEKEEMLVPLLDDYKRELLLKYYCNVHNLLFTLVRKILFILTNIRSTFCKPI